ncbi:hypothetical protein JXB11_04875 [Candidatus Woesearchaeota archaeon]|nr:hypothetical protein [Candidatus Woesearchaeota archaeon]
MNRHIENAIWALETDIDTIGKGGSKILEADRIVSGSISEVLITSGTLIGRVARAAAKDFSAGMSGLISSYFETSYWPPDMKNSESIHLLPPEQDLGPCRYNCGSVEKAGQLANTWPGYR